VAPHRPRRSRREPEPEVDVPRPLRCPLCAHRPRRRSAPSELARMLPCRQV